MGNLLPGDMKEINENLIENTINLRDFVERLLSLAGRAIGTNLFDIFFQFM
jgi:hypothetical protein